MSACIGLVSKITNRLNLAPIRSVADVSKKNCVEHQTSLATQWVLFESVSVRRRFEDKASVLSHSRCTDGSAEGSPEEGVRHVPLQLKDHAVKVTCMDKVEGMKDEKQSLVWPTLAHSHYPITRGVHLHYLVP